MTQLYEEALRPTGLRATQFSILMAVRALEPVPVSQLATLTGTDRTTMSRNLRPLESEGYLRIGEADDRRVHEVRLTQKGARALTLAFPLWERVQNSVVSALGEERTRQLLDDLAAAAAVGKDLASDPGRGSRG
jgi:DNA-binding MarR family transcriptional regulator